MKQVRNLFILTLSLFLFTACGGSPEKQIAQKWKLSDFKAPGMDTENLSPEEEEMLKKFIEEASFEFKEDGTYEISMMGETTKGTWEVDKEGKTLTTKEESGNETKLTIKELSGSKLIITDQESGEMSMTLVPA